MRKRKASGYTLIELMMYMGISAVLVVGVVGFMIRTTQERTLLVSQNAVQQNSRVVMEKMTTSIRNAYQVDVNAAGTEITIYAKNYANPSEPIITIYQNQGQELSYSVGNPTAAGPFFTILDGGIHVAQFHADTVASSVVLQATFEKNGKQASFSSTIAYRQK